MVKIKNQYFIFDEVLCSNYYIIKRNISLNIVLVTIKITILLYLENRVYNQRYTFSAIIGKSAPL
jgi:hypothetical protein